MAEHRNVSLTQWLNRIFNFKSNDRVSNQVGEIIVPTVPITPVANFTQSNASSTTGAFTILTAPTDKDFYLTQIQYSLVKDATCNVGSGSLAVNATIDGVVRSLIRIAVLTTVAERADVTIIFPFPIKLDRGSTLDGGGTFTLGAMIRAGSATGYTVETVGTSTS